MSTATKSSKKSLIIIGGVIAAIALALFGYLMWHVTPGQVTESVKLITITENGCVVETMDGYAITIPKCDGKPGDTVEVTYYVPSKITSGYFQRTEQKAALVQP